MDHVEINIITCLRPGGLEYLSGTLASLRESDWAETGIPVNLFLGSNDDLYVEQHCNDPRVTAVPWPFGQLSDIRTSLNANYIRALSHSPADCGCFVFEDDIEFGRHWLARTKDAMDHIEKVHNEYVLSLYMSGGESALCPYLPGQRYKAYPKNRFYGSQGLYFPARVRGPVSQYCTENCKRHFTDLLVGEWTSQRDCLYATERSVIQHRGRVSNGDMTFHEASDWVRDDAQTI